MIFKIDNPNTCSGFPSAYLISSSGGAAENWPSHMGIYKVTGQTYYTQPVYKHEAGFISISEIT